MKSIEEADIKEGIRVLVRVDFNVPVNEAGIPTDGSRIEASLKTIEYIKNKGGVPILMSHFGSEGKSMQGVIDFARNKYLVLSSGVEFLDNLRMDKREETNDDGFARELASRGEIYVNEAFPSSHREHTSIVGVPKFLPSYAGFRFLEEYEKLKEALNPEHPFFFILGGAKFETKLPLVEKFLNIADYIFIGGANAFPASIMPLASNPKIILPVGDVKALDANAETLELLKNKIKNAKFILWNGPLGKYEDEYTEGTMALAKMIAESGVKTIVGGGDTENVIDELNIKDKFYLISLAGGAMLEFLASGTLPGIEALN